MTTPLPPEIKIHALRQGVRYELPDRPLIELQIHVRNGRKSGFRSGRNEEELRWIATVLRTTLDVPA